MTGSRDVDVVRADPSRISVAGDVAIWQGAAELCLPLGGERLDLGPTLGCGQAFRWRAIEGGQVWEGVAGGRAWRLQVVGDTLIARVLPGGEPDRAAAFPRRYFALDESIEAIQTSFARGHPAAQAAIGRYPGLRVLRQEPVETFLSFAIASATNVPRIQRCLESMAAHYGRPLVAGMERGYHDFPDPATIVGAETAHLAGPCNLAYRARSLQAATAVLVERGRGWLGELARGPYPAARAALDDLPGIGPKIADCICLFGLGFDEAVPIDTHVWAITHELFGTEVPSRTLTRRTYEHLGDLWRDRFGPYAGWAQQYLFQMRRDQPVRERFRP